MDLDRGTLVKLDRRNLPRLDHDERNQIVKVPVSEAVWSIRKRYRGVLGVSMGRAVGALVEHELRGVVDEAGDEPVLLAVLEQRLGRTNPPGEYGQPRISPTMTRVVGKFQ